MFLNKNYILGNELAQLMKIHPANVSILRKKRMHLDDSYTVKKMNNCLFVNSKAINLPVYIRKGTLAHNFTDLTDKLPCTFVKGELDVSEKELERSGIVKCKTSIAGKLFYVFTEEFVKGVGQQIPFTLTEDESAEYVANGTVKHSVRLSKNRFLAWY